MSNAKQATSQPMPLPLARFCAILDRSRKKGVRRSLQLAGGVVKTQVKRRAQSKNKRRYIFISHPMDNTGAPVVLLQIIEEYAQRYGGSQIQLFTPAIQPLQRRQLEAHGVQVNKAALALGLRSLRLQIGIRPNDFVLMNTTAIYENYRDFILLWLKSGRLNHAYWFIHEDKAQLKVIQKNLLDKKMVAQVRSLVNQDKLTLLVPSARTKREYDEVFDTSKVRSVNLHVEVPNAYTAKRPASDYQQLDFLISGTPTDGRKGQFLALTAFYSFIKNYYEKQPSTYRNFKLHLVSIGSDYISQQLRWVADSLLKEHFVEYPSLTKDKALAVTNKCNAVICCSLNETFGLYVAEGMCMGHLVLRNNSAGVDEQLSEGLNGYFIDHTNINQFAAVIEKILNKKTTSDRQLQAMGLASQSIIKNYNHNSYITQLEPKQ